METLQRSLIFGLSVLLSIGAIAGGVKFSYKTVDDSKLINYYLSADTNSQVLGASTGKTEKQNECSESLPVIGWIDFSGKKLIKSSLSAEQSASSCFKNVAEANDAGFYTERD